MATKYTWNPERRRMDLERETVDGAPQVEVFHVKSPETGAVHDVPDDHDAVLALKAMEAGIGNGNGWRWATPGEVRRMYDAHGVPEDERPALPRKRQEEDEAPAKIEARTSTGTARSQR